jgi:hypothetical protein
MPSNSRISHETQKAADQQLTFGLTKHAATLPSMLLAGQTVPTAELTAVLQSRIAATARVTSAHAAYLTAVKAYRDEMESTAPLVSNARAALAVGFAGQIEALADFGLEPRKARTPLSPDEMTVAIAKGKATRVARHTMGPKQKAAIRG